jgi:predicted dehydrogenase
MIRDKRHKGDIMEKLKVKILGSGNAAKKHAIAYESLPDMFEVVQNQWHSNVIDICTPNYMHYVQTLEAAQSGQYVIVEKPIAGSMAEVDDLMSLDNSSRIFPISQYRYMPVSIVDEYFTFVDIRQPRDDAYYRGWRGQQDKSFGGCMTMFGIHIFDLLAMNMHVKRVVYAQTDNSKRGFDVEDSCVVVLELSDGGTATIYIDTPETAEPLFTINRKSVETSVSLFSKQLEDIHKSIVLGTQAPVTLQEARNAIEILTAAYYAAETGEEVTLPLSDDHPFYRGWL